jgi:hypothetical protein
MGNTLPSKLTPDETKRPGKKRPGTKCQKPMKRPTLESITVQQAMKRLGHAFHVIKGHQPSPPSVMISECNLLRELIKEEDGGCDKYWASSEINSMDDKCLFARFSKMTGEEIYNLLNNLNKLDPKMYRLLKKLLTGEENDESIWKKWIDMKIKYLPSPYYFGLVENEILLSDSQASILKNLIPKKVYINQFEKDLLRKFYYTYDLMPGYKFARYGDQINPILHGITDDQFCQILDIFYSINQSLYDSFKRIITNQESAYDHIIYERAVIKFPS